MIHVCCEPGDCALRVVGAEDSDYKRLLTGNEGITSNNTSLLSARIAYQLNLRGPNLTMNTACSSGLTAFHQAMLSLESDECDSAIVAGVSVACTSYAYDAMEASGMLAPDRKCRAFDRRASGMVPAEAAAVIVLKKEGKARRDGHRIYGIVAVVSHTDGFCPDILSQLFKIPVAKLSGRHFNAYLMNGSVFLCVKVN